MKKQIIIICIALLSYSCSFQPNNANGIILMRSGDDTLSLSLVDSYYVVKKYTTKIDGDTLLIDVKSVYTPKETDKVCRIKIPVLPNIKYIKLQNDSVINIFDIPQLCSSDNDYPNQ